MEHHSICILNKARLLVSSPFSLRCHEPMRMRDHDDEDEHERRAMSITHDAMPLFGVPVAINVCAFELIGVLVS